jgi:dCMP deaminase
VTDWDKRFIGLALYVQEWSRDPDTKVGCVIVGPKNEIRSIGYNGFPRGVDDSEPLRYERPAKYLWTEHAERNAIYNAVRAGISLEGCRMFLPWFPCAACARAIIQSGITELVASKPDFAHEKWGEDFRVATILMEEAAVRIRYVNVNSPEACAQPSD